MKRKNFLPYLFRSIFIAFACTATTYSMAKATRFDFVTMPEYQQQSEDNRILKGHVTDEMGQPMIGVVVNIEGNPLKTITDIDGNFEIKVNNNSILVLTYIGYKTETIAVSNKLEVNVSMQPVSATIDDVVVIGYGTAKKNHLHPLYQHLDQKT